MMVRLIEPNRLRAFVGKVIVEVHVALPKLVAKHEIS